MIMAALAPLRRGKWVVAGPDIEDRANKAIEQAVMSAYELGLSGGIPPAMVVSCKVCRQPFFDPSRSESGTCLNCYAKTVELF